MIDRQTKFLSMVLNFTKDPSSKSLRPFIELYGRDRDRMKVEAEILERQLKHQSARPLRPARRRHGPEGDHEERALDLEAPKPRCRRAGSRSALR